MRKRATTSFCRPDAYSCSQSSTHEVCAAIGRGARDHPRATTSVNAARRRGNRIDQTLIHPRVERQTHCLYCFDMRLTLSLVAAVTLVSAGAAGRFDSEQTPPPSTAPKYAFGEPGISPDGREIAFTSGGDIWTVPASGGDARLLAADPAYDRRPLFSPDGRELAFVSSRTGGGDIYVVTLATGTLRRVTWDDGLEQLDGWSRDSQWIYFSSTSHDVAGMNDIFRVPREGGTPTAVTADRYVNEFGAAASPDGHRLAFSARGVGSNQWWRKAGSHIDESELWVVDIDKIAGDGAKAYTEITKRDARQLSPMWNADGSSLFYVADRNGVENIWTRPASATGADRAVTSFHDGRVLWPSITTDGKTVAFERNFGIWTVDTASGQAKEVPITRRGVASSPAPERTRQTNQFSDLALSPDGKKVVFVARGDVFAASAKDGGDAARVTATPAIESDPVWAPDSRRIAYVAAREGTQQLRLLRFRVVHRDAAHVGRRDGPRAGVLARRAVDRVLPQPQGAAGAGPRVEAGPRDRDRHVRRYARQAAAGLVAGRQVDRGVHDRREGLHERRAGLGARRRPAASGQLRGQRVREHDRVEPRRVVSLVHHRSAHRARSARARRPHAADTEVQGRSVSGSLHRAHASTGTPRNPGNPKEPPGTPRNPEGTSDTRL